MLSAGKSSAILSVPTIDDASDESDGPVTATLSSGSGYTVDSLRASAAITVNDNDTPTLTLSVPAQTVSEAAGTVTAALNFPAPGSFQSGLGVLSGWVCEANTVEIEIEIAPATGPPRTYEAGYGTARADTESECGNTDTGFGLLYNWNRLGTGLHTVRVLVDGEAVAHSTFTVTTLGEHTDEEFRRGLHGTHAIEDFPTAGRTVTVEWQETQQNFVITGRE